MPHAVACPPRLILLAAVLPLCVGVLAAPPEGTAAEPRLSLLASLPVPTQCTEDLQGANDHPGQGDLTQFCVDQGDGSPYDVHTLWNWDTTQISGGNTLDACSLYDVDNDGGANLAVCLTLEDGGGPPHLPTDRQGVRLFLCNDSRADRCAGQIQVNVCNIDPEQTCLTDADCTTAGDTCAMAFDTVCEVSQQDTDPFEAGDDYPADTEALCWVNLDDFGSAGTTSTLVDACAFNSESVNSNPVDCVVEINCTQDSDCDDDNECTVDTCNTSINACVHTIDTGASCGDDSSSICDAPDTCDAAGICQPNNEPATTPCRADAGECDVAETCDGAGSCPADGFEAPGTACGDPTDVACNAADTCNASGVCQDNEGVDGAACGDSTGTVCDNPDTCLAGSCVPNYEPATTPCRADAGECDVAESCDGAGSCPADGFEAPGTACGDPTDVACNAPDTCNASGVCQDNEAVNGTACGSDADSICDNPDSCLAGSCAPNYEPGTTQCRAEASDCDVAESCDGAGSCPADGFEAPGAACGDPTDVACNAPDTCNASGVCQDNESVDGTACGSDADGICDNPDSCLAGSCAPNYEPGTTQCRSGNDACDAAEFCTGSSPLCPDDGFEEPGTPCRIGSGDACDPTETCSGTDPDCPADEVADEGTPCGDQTDTVCTDPDSCDGEGFCLPNNEVCAFVTDSSLCPFDINPDKGTCSIGGAACFVGDPTDPCEASLGGLCEQSAQFRLLFTPSPKDGWPAHKLNASNPGQYFYNAIVGGTPSSTLTVTIDIPYPFVTQGAMPVHSYDAALVTTIDGCFQPLDALQSWRQQLTIGDYLDGPSSGSGLTCTAPGGVCSIDGGLDASEVCSFDIDVDIPASGIAYVNVHLDYGLKGVHLDANRCDDGLFDRYDIGEEDEVFGGWDALENTLTNDGPLALANCKPYPFSHFDGTLPYRDQVESLNQFKRVDGVFGTATHSINGSGVADSEILLVHNETNQVIQMSATDDDGIYALEYEHKGMSSWFTVILAEYGLEQEVELKENGRMEVSFDVDTGTTEATWTASGERVKGGDR